MRSAGLGSVTPEVMASGSNVTPSGSCMSADGVASWATTTGCTASAATPNSTATMTDRSTANRRMMTLPLSIATTDMAVARAHHIAGRDLRLQRINEVAAEGEPQLSFRKA